MAADIAAAKQAMRGESRERRRGARDAAGPDAADAATALFMSHIEISPHAVVAGYWPMGDEFDVRPLMHTLHARGHGCCLPVVTGQGAPLTFREWSPGATLSPAAFGTSVPGGDAPEVTPGVLLVPLLAFDGRGCRLGYGGGFYDRTLARLRAAGGPVLAVGIGFEAQRVEAVPAEATDERLDWLLSETRAEAAA